jgi:hypothetical protein
MKVTSLNALWFTYSAGFSSFRDQLNLIKTHITTEAPDVSVLLEMPNPHDPVTDATLLVNEDIWELDGWLASQGYLYSRKLNDKLSVWVVSKTPLVPLLLLGSSTVSGAISSLFKMAELNGSAFINANSTFADCIAQMGKADRSVIVGVKNKDGKAVLPLIATHARCLYMNGRFGRLLVHLLSSFVAVSGIVVGDFNIEPTMASSLDGADFQSELAQHTRSKLLSLPVGVLSAPSTHTAVSVNYPFEPLLLDYFLCKEKLVVGASSVSDAGGLAPLPNTKHPSDHKWVAAVIPSKAMLPVTVEAQEMLSRSLSFQWSQGHAELLAIRASPLTALMEARGSRPATPSRAPRDAPETSGTTVVPNPGPGPAALPELPPLGKAAGVIKFVAQGKNCGAVLVDGTSKPIFFYSSAPLNEADVQIGVTRATFTVAPNERKPGELIALDFTVNGPNQNPPMPRADTAPLCEK